MFAARIVLVSYSAFLIILSLSNLSHTAVEPLFSFDKILHFAAYAAFALLAFFASQRHLQFYILLATGFFLGLGIELMQGHFTETRQTDMLDQLANSLGLLAGAVITSTADKLGFKFKNIKV